MAASLVGALALARSPEMVSFAPVAQAEVASSEVPKLSMDGAKPQLMKMTVPVEASTEPKAVRCVKAAQKLKAAEPKLKLAGLRKPVQRVPGGNHLLVMAEWNDLGVQQRVIWTMLREGREPTAVAVPAVYLVATPNGWLIVQI